MIIKNKIISTDSVAGEEGALKIWSKTGMLRTTLVASGNFFFINFVKKIFNFDL